MGTPIMKLQVPARHMAHACSLSPGKAKPDCKFKASWGCIESSCLKTNQTNEGTGESGSVFKSACWICLETGVQIHIPTQTLPAVVRTHSIIVVLRKRRQSFPVANWLSQIRELQVSQVW